MRVRECLTVEITRVTTLCMDRLNGTKCFEIATKVQVSCTFRYLFLFLY